MYSFLIDRDENSYVAPPGLRRRNVYIERRKMKRVICKFCAVRKALAEYGRVKLKPICSRCFEKRLNREGNL